MLKSLSIQNYALIENLEIDFFRGLNIITGETGAGKSILIGSLQLLLGKRADHSVLFDKDKKCIVEAVFSIGDYELRDFFEQNDLDYDDELIIRRSITPSGKSRAYINDEPVTLNVLKLLSAYLIQMHRQFDNLQINDPAYQLKIIDVFGDNNAILEEYKENYRKYKTKQKSLLELQKQKKSFDAELELMQYQFEELDRVELSPENFTSLQDQYNNLSNAENIKMVLRNAYNALFESEFALVEKLDEVYLDINNLELRDEDFDKAKEKFYDALETIRETANEFIEIADNTEYDAQRIEELKYTIDIINNLMIKHKVDDVESLLEIKEDLSRRLQKVFDVDKDIDELQKAISELEKRLTDLSSKLMQKRKKAAAGFSKKVEALLKELAMPYAGLKIELNTTEDFGPYGKDKISFLFSANKGNDFKAIKDVASGGELARLALSVEAVIADKMALPTLIFDEIEAGISGEVAMKMGKIIKDMSAKHQLISITHSPQIASKADYHYFVYKMTDTDKTKTAIRLLSDDERILELAIILSGDPPSDSAISNAKELINKK